MNDVLVFLIYFFNPTLSHGSCEVIPRSILLRHLKIVILVLLVCVNNPELLPWIIFELNALKGDIRPSNAIAVVIFEGILFIVSVVLMIS